MGTSIPASWILRGKISPTLYCESEGITKETVLGLTGWAIEVKTLYSIKIAKIDSNDTKRIIITLIIADAKVLGYLANESVTVLLQILQYSPTFLTLQEKQTEYLG